MTKGGTHQLGERGFTSRQPEQDGINLRDIDQRIEDFVEEGVAEETDSGYVFHAEEAGYQKVLGGGKLTQDIEVHAPEFSGSAKRKLEEDAVEE